MQGPPAEQTSEPSCSSRPMPRGQHERQTGAERSSQPARAGYSAQEAGLGLLSPQQQADFMRQKAAQRRQVSWAVTSQCWPAQACWLQQKATMGLARPTTCTGTELAQLLTDTMSPDACFTVPDAPRCSTSC